MDIWQAVVIGLTEGITEFLPVSSTGHLILVNRAMNLDAPQTKPAVDALTIVVQGGAILAVAGVFWPRVRSMIRGVLGKDNAGFALLVNLCFATVPAVVLGLLFDKAIESRLFFAGPVIGAIAVGGIYMLLVDQWLKGRFGVNTIARHGRTIDDMTPLESLFIGFMQCIAMWPGTSRSMMGITAGTFAGLRPRDAAEFAFLLGLPTLGGATIYKLAKNINDPHDNMFKVLGAAPIIVALVVATVSAFIAVKWLVGFLNRRGLAAFGWYRLALAAVLLPLALNGWLTIQPASKPAAHAPTQHDRQHEQIQPAPRSTPN